MEDEELKDMLDKVQNKIYPKHLAFKRIKENYVQKSNVFFVCFEKDKYGKEPIFGCEDKEILKQKLIDKIKPDLTDYYQKLSNNEIWNHIEKCGEYEIIEINRA